MFEWEWSFLCIQDFSVSSPSPAEARAISFFPSVKNEEKSADQIERDDNHGKAERRCERRSAIHSGGLQNGFDEEIAR